MKRQQRRIILAMLLVTILLTSCTQITNVKDSSQSDAFQSGSSSLLENSETAEKTFAYSPKAIENVAVSVIEESIKEDGISIRIRNQSKHELGMGEEFYVLSQDGESNRWLNADQSVTAIATLIAAGETIEKEYQFDQALTPGDYKIVVKISSDNEKGVYEMPFSIPESSK